MAFLRRRGIARMDNVGKAGVDGLDLQKGRWLRKSNLELRVRQYRKVARFSADKPRQS